MASASIATYLAAMSTRDELKGLEQFLSALDSGEMTIARNGVNVTQSIAEDLRKDIRYLEKVLARSEGPDAQGS